MGLQRGAAVRLCKALEVVLRLIVDLRAMEKHGKVFFEQECDDHICALKR